MGNPTPWRDLFTQEAKLASGPPLCATMENDGKLKLKIPKAITDQTADRGRLSLVGKVHGARPNIDDVRKWARFKWKIKGSLNIIAMANDYFLFVFSNEEDRDSILSMPWFIGSRGLYLEKWKPGFDPSKKQLMQAPLWVTLPNLPLDLWHHKVFEGIGNSFGKFVTADDVTKARTRMVAARFCVQVDFGVKLPGSITLESEIGNVEQVLEYEANHCLCSICHQVGHSQKSCPRRIVLSNKEWRPKTIEEASPQVDIEGVPDPETEEGEIPGEEAASQRNEPGAVVNSDPTLSKNNKHNDQSPTIRQMNRRASGKRNASPHTVGSQMELEKDQGTDAQELGGHSIRQTRSASRGRRTLEETRRRETEKAVAEGRQGTIDFGGRAPSGNKRQ